MYLRMCVFFVSNNLSIQSIYLLFQRYNLEGTEEGRKICTMKHYQTLLNTISTANLTHEEVLEEVDRFIALCYPSYGKTYLP